MTKRFAFTLAEVLITLGIIGVVAALTIPTLINNYQKKVYVAKLQQTYSQIANAAKLLMVDEDVDNLNDTYLYKTMGCNLGGTCFQESVGRFLKKYFRIAKDCGDENASDCFADSYTSLDGTEVYLSYPWYSVILNNGVTISMYPFSVGSPANFIVDLNGKSGPNQYGRDYFEFSMNYRGNLAESFDDGGGMEVREPEDCGVVWDSTYGNLGCFNKIIADGWRMDY